MACDINRPIAAQPNRLSVVSGLGPKHFGPYHRPVTTVLGDERIRAANPCLPSERARHRSGDIDKARSIGHHILDRIDATCAHYLGPQLGSLGAVLGDKAIKVATAALTVESAIGLANQIRGTRAVRGHAIASIDRARALARRPEHVAVGVVFE